MALPVAGIFAGAFAGALVQIASSLVGRVLIALGITYVTYQGFSFVLDSLAAMFVQNVGAAGPVAMGVVSTLRLDDALGVILGAVAAKYALNGLTSGAMTKMVIK